MSGQSIPHLPEQYMLGEMFSNKNGVQCYPATDNRTGLRYIVKVHKFPHSSSVTDAFILSGAFTNARDVNAYYADLAKDLCRQVAILNALSQCEYFSHFTFCESVQCKDIGYEVWLIAPYKSTLAALFDIHQLNQREIVQLGISLCRALSVCREAGFLYTGVKPENIFISESGQYTIGDVGFIPISSLPYAALPVRHHTIYTPADNHDCFSHINDNLDVYSVGVVLYQAALGGKQPENITNPPPNIGREVADIIMTACSPSTNRRWKTPEEMEAALIACQKTEEKE